MAKYIAERHISTENGIVKPGEEVEIKKQHVKAFKDAGWISDLPKSANKDADKDADNTDDSTADTADKPEKKTGK